LKFDSFTINKLKRLQLVAKQIKAGIVRGERRSPRHGQSIEFADYRSYVPGDDLRQLDWNVYARHNQPFIKLRENEEDLSVYVLVDGSKSMDWGIAEENKFTYACKLAAGFSVISLFTGDYLWLDVIGTGFQFGPMRGQGNLLRVLDSLDQVHPKGRVNIKEMSRQFSQSRKRPGLVILISDLLLPEGYKDGLKYIQGFGHEIILLQTLCPEELHPSIEGEMRLVDAETGAFQEVNIDRGMLRVYNRRLKSWQAEIHKFCNQRQIRYLTVDTSIAWEKFFMYDMLVAGILQ
jgi:uncharacterized protein (DUF58 family)